MPLFQGLQYNSKYGHNGYMLNKLTNIKQGEKMKKMTKKQLLKQVEKQDSIIKTLRADFDNLYNDYDTAKESIRSLQKDLDSTNQVNKNLRFDLQETKQESLENKVKLLEKIVSLYESKPKDSIFQYPNSSVVKSNGVSPTITTASTSSTMLGI